MIDTPEEQQQKAKLAQAFLTELRELMKRHHVTDIVAEDHYPGYAECGEDIRMTATMHIKEEYLCQEINLGRGFHQVP